MDQTFFRIGDLLLTFDRIIKGVSKDRTDIHDIHKIKQRTIHHARHGNLLFHTEHIFRSQQGIQHLVSRLVLCFICFDLFFHPVKISRSFFIVILSSERNDMMLEIMVFVIDDIHGLLRLLVLDILVVQDRLHTCQLVPHPQIHPLHMVGIHDRHTSEIDQCTHCTDLQHIGPAEWCILEYKAHIADQEYSQRDRYVGKQLLIRHIQLTFRLCNTFERQPGQGIYDTIADHQTKHTTRISRPIVHIIAITVDLPFQRGSKLSHHKRPGTHIPDILCRCITADIDKAVHENDRRHHAENP